MTIDLGFAWLALPSGLEISIVDVPGHERFVHNMLAGVGGIDVALLVIAADEGIMPQTREHLDILDLLGIDTGVVAVTKIDIVDQEWLDLVVAEIEDGLKETSLAGAPLVPVSSTTGRGLDQLLTAIEAVLRVERARPSTGKPRLPIDRVFTMAGFGTVVTGTLVDGSLEVGQDVEVQPGSRKARVRGLQSHRKKVTGAIAGTRVAVNLTGLSTDELHRGDVLTTPGSLRPTRLVDVRLRMVRAGPRKLRHNAEVTFHTGSAETIGKVALLDQTELAPGQAGLAQIRLQQPVALAEGDLFVVRLLTPALTIGGGTVIEPHPRRHRRFQEPVLERLEVLERGTPGEVLLQQLRVREPAEVRGLLGRVTMPANEALAALAELVDAGEVIALDGALAAEAPGIQTLSQAAFLVSRTGWERFGDQTRSILAQFHASSPFRQGMPREELRTRLGLDARTFNRVVERMVRDGGIAETGPLVRLVQHEVRFTMAQQQAIDRMLAELREAATSPPTRDQLEARHGISAEITQALIDRGDLVEVAADLVYDPETYQRVVGAIVVQLRKNASVSVAQVRDALDTSRRYALALLSHLDERRITRRVGDERVLM